jgi:membrane protein required for beta-lactamase induction
VPFHRSNDEVVACVGKAAMTGFLEETPNSSAAARNAMRLVTRTLFIWITVIAVMTLFGWAV